ncbi:hypothetical protein [Oleiharenicola lentus]|uniref:hypothetical protein n=1 Tax=Oleiharenicola lentus TaxID=2508720 RepID=UPI003F673F86
MNNSMFLIGAGLVLLLVIAALIIPGRKKSEPAPVGHTKPAAEEPTPDRSVTATPAEIASAKKHTPPA